MLPPPVSTASRARQRSARQVPAACLRFLHALTSIRTPDASVPPAGPAFSICAICSRSATSRSAGEAAPSASTAPPPRAAASRSKAASNGEPATVLSLPDAAAMAPSAGPAGGAAVAQCHVRFAGCRCGLRHRLCGRLGHGWRDGPARWSGRRRCLTETLRKSLQPLAQFRRTRTAPREAATVMTLHTVFAAAWAQRTEEFVDECVERVLLLVAPDPRVRCLLAGGRSRARRVGLARRRQAGQGNGQRLHQGVASRRAPAFAGACGSIPLALRARAAERPWTLRLVRPAGLAAPED